MKPYLLGMIIFLIAPELVMIEEYLMILALFCSKKRSPSHNEAPTNYINV